MRKAITERTHAPAKRVSLGEVKLALVSTILYFCKESKFLENSTKIRKAITERIHAPAKRVSLREVNLALVSTILYLCKK